MLSPVDLVDPALLTRTLLIWFCTSVCASDFLPEAGSVAVAALNANQSSGLDCLPAAASRSSA
jgi:hypothetical protein